MKITEVTVSYSETCSLPNYSNVKPSATLTAQIAVNETQSWTYLGTKSATQQATELLEEAKAIVREQIDRALEENGLSPKYDTEDLCKVIYSTKKRIVAIVPENADRPKTFAWHYGQPVREDAALSQAELLADRMHEDYEIFNCSGGDLQVLEDAPIVEEDQPEQVVPVPEDVEDDFDDDEDGPDF